MGEANIYQKAIATLQGKVGEGLGQAGSNADAGGGGHTRQTSGKRIQQI